jgi:hypothetical protein
MSGDGPSGLSNLNAFLPRCRAQTCVFLFSSKKGAGLVVADVGVCVTRANPPVPEPTLTYKALAAESQLSGALFVQIVSSSVDALAPEVVSKYSVSSLPKLVVVSVVVAPCIHAPVVYVNLHARSLMRSPIRTLVNCRSKACANLWGSCRNVGARNEIVEPVC